MNDIQLPKKLQSLFNQLETARKRRDAEEERRVRVKLGVAISNQKDARIKDLANQMLVGQPVGHSEHRNQRRGPGHGQRPGTPPSDRQRLPSPYRLESRAQEVGKPPEVLGLPFHNPYTFVPFHTAAPPLGQPSLLTADEVGQEPRWTGLLELEVRTERPLLSSNPLPAEDGSPDGKNRFYPGLAIGNDVIVPATGVRGSLRNLLVILTGGSLTNFDPDAYATEGRDKPLGPAGLRSPDGVPANVFLGRVLDPGSRYQAGWIELGDTELIQVAELANLVQPNLQLPLDRPRDRREGKNWDESCEVALADYRPRPRDTKPLFLEKRAGQWVRATGNNLGTWEIKFSGRPIRLDGKKEGAFRGTGQRIQVPTHIWTEYQSRHRHAFRPELKRGDLVWIEPANPTQDKISSGSDIASLQWARWGRKGYRFGDLIPHRSLDPNHGLSSGDNAETATQVDWVTDLFGRVAPTPGGSFAGRILPENLVFPDSKPKLERIQLAPLSAPHPGCSAFYRWHDRPNEADPAKVSGRNQFRGYKVYRAARPGDSPWLWSEQGVWSHDGTRMDDPAKLGVSKQVELLPPGMTGQVRLAFRALTKQDIALLLYATTLPWRIGGGKPLGLGLCTVQVKSLVDEDGSPLAIDEFDVSLLPPHIKARGEFWTKTQEPVDRLRYPRAVDQNYNRTQRGGHVWFSRHAGRVKQTSGEGVRPGLEKFRVAGPLADWFGARDVLGQALPPFDPEDPLADLLFGYDGLPLGKEWDPGLRLERFTDYRAFDAAGDRREDDKSGGKQNPNRDDRQRDREDR